MLRSAVRAVSRGLHHSAARARMAVPDNAPTQTENEKWLESLQEMDEAAGAVNTSELYNTEAFEQANSGASRFVEKTEYTVESMSEQDGLMKVRLPISSFHLRSSAFSHLKPSERPKVDGLGFSDLRIVELGSGRGGNGCVSFLRDAGRSVGPPDGGDGGDGGSILVQAVEGLSSLNHLKVKYIAPDGGAGKGGQLDGKAGNNLLIEVPVGTVIKFIPEYEKVRQANVRRQGAQEVQGSVLVDAIGKYRFDTVPAYIQLKRDRFDHGEGWLFKDRGSDYHSERSYFKKLQEKIKTYDYENTIEEITNDVFPINGVDLSEPSRDPIMLIKGGIGGLGNMHFLTGDIRNPRFAKVGRYGLRGHFVFELKLLADLGLVGLPNAGKSTLLRAISNATPRVGHWEFTTLHPTIGTIEMSIDRPTFTVADIPGIIKGASQNKGMGIDFLRHVERSGGLVFVISLGSQDPVADLQVLLDEMGHRINYKNILVVATKADLPNSQHSFQKLKSFVETKDGWKIVPVCAQRHENVRQCISLMFECAGKF